MGVVDPAVPAVERLLRKLGESDMDPTIKVPLGGVKVRPGIFLLGILLNPSVDLVRRGSIFRLLGDDDVKFALLNFFLFSFRSGFGSKASIEIDRSLSST